MSTKLTKAIIVEAEPKSKEYFIWDTEVRKLALRVQPSGRKTFVCQYRFNRRTRRILIGPADVLPLPFARDIAREAVVAVSRGMDPAEQREAARMAITVKDLAERFDDSHISFHVKASTAREYRYSLKAYILPALASKKVADVSRRNGRKADIRRNELRCGRPRHFHVRGERRVEQLRRQLSRQLDVRVNPEEVCRVVAGLDLGQTRIGRSWRKHLGGAHQREPAASHT